MMEASVVSKDTGHTNPLKGSLDTSSIPAPASTPPSSPLSPPSLPSSNPPVRPCRPKQPLPPAKSSQLPSCPPLPAFTPPTLPPSFPPVSKPPPPLPPISKPPPPPSSNPLPPSVPPPLSSNPPPPSLPAPLSPTPVSPSPLLSLQPTISSDLTPSFSPPPPISPTILSSSSPPPTPPTPPVIPPSSPTPPLLSSIDGLVGSVSVWQLKGLSQDQTTSIMEKETAGAFLVYSTEGKGLTLSVRVPDEQGPPLVHNLMVKQHQTFLHLDGSSLVFDDIFKLISFYCVSRDILETPLRLPWAITTATKREDLEVISAMGADFWTSHLNQQAKNQDLVLDENHSRLYLYVNPVTVEESPNNDLNHSSITTSHFITNQNITSSLQNGEAAQKKSAEVKGQTKTMPNPEIKYKRPPPRPPSLGSGFGMGLLFSYPPSLNTSSSATPAAERKEEGKGGVGEREEKKSMSMSLTPSRPPVPLQSRAAPPLPPAPLRRTSSRKSTDREVGEGTEREKGQNPTKKTEREGGGERGEEKNGSKSGQLGEGVEQENSSQNQEDEGKKDREKSEKEDDKEEEEVKMDKEDEKQKSSPHCPPLLKKPSRPVPPPRRKPCSPDTPVNPNQAAGGLTNQTSGVRVPPPSPARRPDVSLYSPQGGAVLVTDPDSCSTSSTEEDGEPNQEQEPNHNHPAESRSPKVAVRRTPTVMLDRARYRLSTVITGLISHDRRLTQRIVELARDPLSYFGNLVKEHRAFTLETMSKHSTSTELLQEIRQMITQLKSYLLQSTELQAMLEPQHQYTQEKLDNIAEAALCKSVLKPLREPIYQSLEKLHNNDSSLKQLAQNQSIVLGSTTTALGITTAVPEASAMEKISIKMNNLHLEYSPQKKIELMLKACKIIYDSMSVSCPGRAHGADDFLPVMMYVLARCNLSGLQLDVEYMMELMDPSLALGEGSYYLTTTYGALEHIKTFDQQRSATRQLSREVQDSIHRWERRRTLNQERMSQGSVRDFLTVCCPVIGSNLKTLGVLPTTTMQQLAEQCAARFEQDSYMLSVYLDGVHQHLGPTELALSVKNSSQPGAYCFVYHPIDQPIEQPARSCPTDAPPAPPEKSFVPGDFEAADTVEPEAEEESLISL
ncbi:ras and Rab interactor 3 [Cottoperca gobio]|uniref:Ras and Rab interactor 3 n=1 Tax=Cottoperca gobio TaxID=56716 RepID=A0A6J2S5Q6_COTGO|nr:ras and Rab interactor 3-like [Cottoperca gobio]